jgi:alpha-glucosidase (family GH31 glycosyl hydrolase)
MRRGVVFDHDNIGSIDLTNPDNIVTTLWHARGAEFSIITGSTMKDVTTGISSIVGRMKVLPEWTQNGAIVGL